MLGERIREIREAQGITQEKLGEALGVTKASVSNWENDNSPPSVDTLKNIAKYFHCSTDYLLELDHTHIIDVSDLSPAKIAHIQLLVNDFLEE